MKKLILLLTGCAFVISSFAQLQSNNVALTLHKTTKVCTPDGVANTDGTEPWVSTWINMAAKKTANTKDEMNANFQIAYNDTYIWVVGQQTGNATIDTGVAAIPNTWERDDFEVFVQLDTLAWQYKGKTGASFFQFREQRATTFPWMFDDHNSAYSSFPTNWAIGNVDAGDGSFIEEWQIPWASLLAVNAIGDSSKFDGTYIKFEIQAADNTTGAAGGRNDQRFWINNSDNEYQDTRTLSVVKLAEPVAVKINPTISSLSVYPTVAERQLTISQNVTGKVFNMSGQQVLDLKNVNSVDVSGLSSGVYFLRANNQTVKFVKR